jgi:hypothetical protein
MPTLAHPGQAVTMVVAEGDVGAGVLCEGCLAPTGLNPWRL